MKPSSYLYRRMNRRFRWIKMRGAVNTSADDIYGPGRFPPEKVRKLTIVAAIVDGEIRELAGLERSELVAAAQAIGGVDGGGGDGFRRCHSHLRRSQREHHGHGGSGRRSRIEVGGQHHGQSEIDHPARRRITRRTEMIDRP